MRRDVIFATRFVKYVREFKSVLQNRKCIYFERACQEESRLNTRLFYFCLKGVAGIVFQTKQYQIKRSDHYLTQKRDTRGNFIK